MKRYMQLFFATLVLLLIFPRQEVSAYTVVGVITLGETVEITIPAKESYVYVFTPEEDVECVFYCDPAGCMEATISAVIPDGPNVGGGRASQFVQAGEEADLYIYNYTDTSQTYILHLEPAAPAQIVMEEAVTKNLGDKFRLEFTLAPENARNETWVSWTSDNEAVVTIDNRDILCVGKGTANVTVTLEGGAKGTCKVTVVDPAQESFDMYLDGVPDTAWIWGDYLIQAIAPEAELAEGVVWKVENASAVEYYEDFDCLILIPKMPETITVTATAVKTGASASAKVEIAYRYRVTQGDGATISQGEALTLRTDGAYLDFTGILIDEVWVEAGNYTVKRDSMTITINEKYLAGLGSGTHGMILLFEGNGEMRGTAYMTFTIKENRGNATQPTVTGPAETGTEEGTQPVSIPSTETAPNATGEQIDPQPDATGLDPVGFDNIQKKTPWVAIGFGGAAVLSAGAVGTWYFIHKKGKSG